MPDDNLTQGAQAEKAHLSWLDTTRREQILSRVDRAVDDLLTVNRFGWSTPEQARLVELVVTSTERDLSQLDARIRRLTQARKTGFRPW